MKRRDGACCARRFWIAALLFALVFAACGDGWRGGIHAQMAWSEERGLRVVQVPNGPSKRAGLRVDDRIVKIEGASVAGRPVAEVVADLRGQVGTRVRVTVERSVVDGGVADDGAAPVEIEELEIERAPYARD